jgi:hypothetical protein
MVKVYAIVLAVGVVLLITWVFAAYVGGSVPAWRRFDPEENFGKTGRRVVAGMVGFGLAGMSAEFSPLELSWPVALILAVIGAAALAWYSGFVDRPRQGPVAGTRPDQS